jgi:dihydroorotate dehydrogenase (fumarate)
LANLEHLAGRARPSLAATGGVHTAVDAVQAAMAGADAVQVVSVLLRRGPERLASLREELARWLEEHGYGSLAEARGSMSLRCPDPAAHERANYMQILQSWRGSAAGSSPPRADPPPQREAIATR